MKQLFEDICGEKVAVAIDVSGSMICDPTFDTNLTRVFTALIQAGISYIDLIFFDYGVTKHVSNVCIEDAIPHTWKIPGGGGSCFRSTADLVNKIDASAVIVISDLYMNMPDEMLYMQTFWMRTGSKVVPTWGRVFDLDTNQALAV